MIRVPTPNRQLPGGPCRSLRRSPVSDRRRHDRADRRARGPDHQCGPGRGARRWCGASCSPTVRGACPGCGAVGVYRDSVERRVTDVPVAGHPLQLRVRVPRYRCVHDRMRPGGVLSRQQLGWPARAPRPPAAARRSSCAAWLSKGHGRGGRPRAGPQPWDTVNSIAVAATSQVLLSAGPARLDGVAVIGVDEHSGPTPARRRRRRVRHRDHRPHRCRRRSRTGPVARHGPRAAPRRP